MSKELEALKNIRDICKDMTNIFDEDLDIIEIALKDYYALKKECKEAKWYQEHKALEIIKDKPQREIILFLWGKLNTYEDYLKETDKWDIGYGDLVLTEEEYDLLKEVLL